MLLLLLVLEGLEHPWHEIEKDPSELPEDRNRFEEDPFKGDDGGEIFSRFY